MVTLGGAFAAWAGGKLGFRDGQLLEDVPQPGLGAHTVGQAP